jgi:hypothetical protein
MLKIRNFRDSAFSFSAFWPFSFYPVVEVNGFEPLTFCLQSRRSTN